MGATGSGLGLNIVKELVGLHWGSVVVVDAPGGGAIFQVELPIRAPDGVFVRMGGKDALEQQAVDIELLPALPPLIEVNFQPGKPRVLVAGH